MYVDNDTVLKIIREGNKPLTLRDILDQLEVIGNTEDYNSYQTLKVCVAEKLQYLLEKGKCIRRKQLGLSKEISRFSLLS